MKSKHQTTAFLAPKRIPSPHFPGMIDKRHTVASDFLTKPGTHVTGRMFERTRLTGQPSRGRRRRCPSSVVLSLKGEELWVIGLGFEPTTSRFGCYHLSFSTI